MSAIGLFVSIMMLGHSAGKEYDQQAREKGYLSRADQRTAEHAGVTDAAVWRQLREQAEAEAARSKAAEAETSRAARQADEQKQAEERTLKSLPIDAEDVRGNAEDIETAERKIRDAEATAPIERCSKVVAVWRRISDDGSLKVLCEDRKEYWLTSPGSEAERAAKTLEAKHKAEAERHRKELEAATAQPRAKEPKLRSFPGNAEDRTTAEREIRRNFKPNDCLAVVAVWRLSDGSLSALCENGEDFRLLFDGPMVAFVGRPIVMRCSAARELMPGC